MKNYLLALTLTISIVPIKLLTPVTDSPSSNQESSKPIVNDFRYL
ncbi:MAG: hypothetical protein PHY93_00230 [Bacteriovorax sp.]|nr:hypothetical protein [Bacteriovorax sp.]